MSRGYQAGSTVNAERFQHCDSDTCSSCCVPQLRVLGVQDPAVSVVCMHRHVPSSCNFLRSLHNLLCASLLQSGEDPMTLLLCKGGAMSCPEPVVHTFDT